MDWKVKAAVFRLLSVLPFGSAVLLQLQKSVAYEVPDFVRLFRDAGYAIALDEPTVSAHDPEILQRLSSDFQSFDHDDLFTLRSWIVATSAARQPSPTRVPA